MSAAVEAEGDLKDLYEIGEVPPLGHLPKQMYAWTIRPDRHGVPEESMLVEVMDTPKPGPGEVTILVMAAGVNFNGVWAGLGTPVSVFRFHKAEYHIAGSDASGIIWALGDGVTNWEVGDEVVVHCGSWSGNDEECNGGDPMFSPSFKIWGYETPDGSFAQFTRVQAQQCMPRPQNYSWEESACYTLTLATSYRMLYGHAPHTIKPGDNVLVWGASGGLGSFAVQLCRNVGANAIGVVSDDAKIDYVMGLGAVGVINRKNFDCWGQLPSVEDAEAYGAYNRKVREFGAAIWAITGKGNDVDIVFEHPGESTFPVSTFVCKTGGMIVYCAGTTGYNMTFDARYVWMRQKRIQGSHFANAKQANEANRLVLTGKIDPGMSECFVWADIAKAHTKMNNNEHLPGNMAVLITAQKPGLKTFDEVKAG